MDTPGSTDSAGQRIDWGKVARVAPDAPVSTHRSPRPPRLIPAGAIHDPSTAGSGPHRGCLYGIDANMLPQRIRNSHNKYPITAAQLEVLIENTGALCMICRDCHATTIEHCHKSGRIRGITCQQCNDRCTVVDNGLTDSGRIIGSYGYPCWCVDLERQDGVAEAQRLLEAARVFIKHAMAVEAHDVTSAFTLLAVKPYPLA